MYHSITSPKEADRSRILSFQVSWHLITFFIWLAFYFIENDFKSQNNFVFTSFELIFCLILFGILQEFLISRILKTFPFWIFISIIGVIAGILFTVIFIITLLLVVVGVGIFTTGTDTVSVILSAFLIPGSAGAVFFFYTYVVWYKVVKPIHNSNNLSERNRFMFEAITVYILAVYACFVLAFIFLFIFQGNVLLASFLSFAAFSYGTNSGFKDIYKSNLHFKGFETKQIT